jgi:hypothetical protein
VRHEGTMRAPVGDRAEHQHVVDDCGDERADRQLSAETRMKLRSIRGPNCWEANVRATMVTENTTPTTVMTAAAMAPRRLRAASAEPCSNQAGSTKRPA